MNRQEAFDAWKARKSRDDQGREFTDRVMASIRRRDRARAANPMMPLLLSISASPWARVAAMITGTLLGLARIIATLHLILFA